MSEMKTQVVWLPDGFGGGEHTEVCRATDYAALEAENENLRLSWGLLRSENNALRQQRDKLAGLLRDIFSSESRGLDWAKKINAALAELNP